MLFAVDSRRVSFHNISLSPRLDQVASSRSLWLRSATLLVSDEEKLLNKAIVVLDSQNGKLGYVPEKDNVVFSRLMDAGKLLTARVLTVKNQEFFTKISMAIFLIDY